MTTMKNSIHDNANGLDYTLVNDHYLPNLTVATPAEQDPTGRWGRLHKTYLKEQHPIQYAVYFRLRSLYAVLPGVAAILDSAGSRVWLLPVHHRRNGHRGSRGMVQRLDCRTVMSKFPAHCPYSSVDSLSFAIYNRKTY